MREAISWYLGGKEYRIGELVLDAVVRETHNFSSEISEHPVENGCVIADHVYNKPISLELDCIITNTPMSWVVVTALDSLKRFSLDQSNNFSELAFRKIEEIFSKRELITIATSLKDYDNMVLESLSVERGGGNSASLHFTCTAKQIRVVEQARIPVPKPKVERAKPKKNLGKQESKKMERTMSSKTSRPTLERSSLMRILGMDK